MANYAPLKIYRYPFDEAYSRQFRWNRLRLQSIWSVQLNLSPIEKFVLKSGRYSPRSLIVALGILFTFISPYAALKNSKYGYIERSYHDVKCLQEISPSASNQFKHGLSGNLDNQAKRSPTKRAEWRYDMINQILTCFKREDFQGTIQTFANNRGDFLVTVVKCDDKTLGIVNCHRTCKGSKDEFIYLVDVFSAWDAVDAIVLAGDFNLQNVYYGKSVDRNYNPKDPKNKIQILLCYLLLFTNSVPNEWQDKDRGYEIDYLCTSRNFKYFYTVEIAKPTNVAHQSDHEPYGAVYSLDGSIDPCTFAIDNKDESWQDLKSHLTHLLGLNMKLDIVFETASNETYTAEISPFKCPYTSEDFKKTTTLPGNSHLIRDVESATPSSDESSPLTKQSSIMTKNEEVRVKKTGYDFTWLGFNITGNMSDGIFIEDVGPTNTLIKAGDRVKTIKVAFKKMIYEDALAILSYVSPYDVTLQLERTDQTKFTYQINSMA
uniref:PDZ domain-containing protein n=1 Tax=Tetranychus urticae TaxID=32264 RepID=T1JZG2_TETUR